MKRVLSSCLFLLGLAIRPALANDTVYYYHTDAQGTAVVVTDASHNVVERTWYGPYGEVLNRPLRDGPGYTGHEEDAATGLDNMQQRYYDPMSGRFPSPDPMEVDTATGSNFNRYAYAADNPYRYTDPDGRAETQNIGQQETKLRRQEWQRANSGSLAEKMPGVTAFLQGASVLGSAPEMAGRAGLGSGSNSLSQAVNDGVASSGEFTRHAPTGVAQIESDPAVQNWEDQVRDSSDFNDRDENKRREDGIWIYTNDLTHQASIVNMPPAVLDPTYGVYRSIDAGPPPQRLGYTYRGSEHSHPFPEPSGRTYHAYQLMAWPEPSEKDIKYTQHYGGFGIVISHYGTYYFGSGN